MSIYDTKPGGVGASGVSEIALKNFRKDVVLELCNEAGDVALAYRIFRCRPSTFEALPSLDAAASAVAIQTPVLENDGRERDYDVVEPTEPAFSEPAQG